MADIRAALAVSEALRGVLRSSYVRNDFDNTELVFEINTPQQFTSNRPQNGITIFLYRIYISGANRIPAGRIDLNGRRQKPLLPLELHYLVTVWAQEYTLQHTLATWVMRTIEDNALLNAGVLNAGGTQIFRADEAVEICLAEMRTEDLFRIWDVLAATPYQLSIPYLARVVGIESLVHLPAPDGPPIQTRGMRYGTVEPPQ
jgi:hypothetical protein